MAFAEFLIVLTDSAFIAGGWKPSGKQNEAGFSQLEYRL